MVCFGLVVVLFCQPPEAPPPVAVDAARFCALYEPVYWKTTDSNKAAVRRNNAKWNAICKDRGVPIR